MTVGVSVARGVVDDRWRGRRLVDTRNQLWRRQILVRVVDARVDIGHDNVVAGRHRPGARGVDGRQVPLGGVLGVVGRSGCPGLWHGDVLGVVEVLGAHLGGQAGGGQRRLCRGRRTREGHDALAVIVYARKPRAPEDGRGPLRVAGLHDLGRPSSTGAAIRGRRRRDGLVHAAHQPVVDEVQAGYDVARSGGLLLGTSLEQPVPGQ